MKGFHSIFFLSFLLVVALAEDAEPPKVEAAQAATEAAPAAPVDDCPIICPVLYSPICAKFEEEHKTFSNNCELKMHNCQGKSIYVKVENRACPKKEDTPQEATPQEATQEATSN